MTKQRHKNFAQRAPPIGRTCLTQPHLLRTPEDKCPAHNTLMLSTTLKTDTIAAFEQPPCSGQGRTRALQDVVYKQPNAACKNTTMPFPARNDFNSKLAVFVLNNHVDGIDGCPVKSCDKVISIVPALSLCMAQQSEGHINNIILNMSHCKITCD